MSQVKSDLDQLPTVAGTLRPQIWLDLVLDANVLKDHIDVRRGLVLAVKGNQVFITQTRPPVCRSMVGRELEASFVVHGFGDPVRWGWMGRIVAQVPDYQPSPDGGETVMAVCLEVLDQGRLTPANLRLHYRVAEGLNGRVAIRKPEVWREGDIMDLSGGGLGLKLPQQVIAVPGARHRLVFCCRLDGATREEVEINCEAEVVRLAPSAPHHRLQAGLRFCELDGAAGRQLQKALNFYMREERKARLRLAECG